ncbi:hypothetical protein P7D43_15905, partial [Enterococcus avium]
MKLEQFKGDSLYSEALEYWCEEWKSCTEMIKSGSIGIEVVNIRIILSDIINEYDLNDFESDNNRKVYIKLLEKVISEKHLEFYRDELLILKEKLEKKNSRAAYVIAKEVLRNIEKVNFSQNLFDELLGILESKEFSKSIRAKIRCLTKNMIVDLITTGRNIEDIEEMTKDVFGKYIISEDIFFPVYKYSPPDLSKEELIEYIDNLKISDRLEKFRENLFMKESEYLFQTVDKVHFMDAVYSLFFYNRFMKTNARSDSYD